MSGVRMPKVGEVWTRKNIPTVQLKITEVIENVASSGQGHVRFDQTCKPGDAPVNFTDMLFNFMREADPPPADPETHNIQSIQVVEPAPAPKVEQLLAEMTPEENEAAHQAASTAQMLYDMLRLTKPSVFEAVTCCVSLLLEVSENCGVEIDSLCELIKRTQSRLVQHHAEVESNNQAAASASEAS